MNVWLWLLALWVLIGTLAGIDVVRYDVKNHLDANSDVLRLVDLLWITLTLIMFMILGLIGVIMAAIHVGRLSTLNPVIYRRKRK